MGAYKSLSRVERAFRSHESVDLKIRPIFHHLLDRVRTHELICMLAYYVEWHKRQRLAPMLFDDTKPDAAEPTRPSPVAPAQPSESAEDKPRTKRTPDGNPVHSFQSLLTDLATIVRNRILPKLPDAAAFDQTTRPTPLQQKALDLLGVRA